MLFDHAVQTNVSPPEGIAAIKQAEADLALSYVRAPIAGEIIKIRTRSGETISSMELLRLVEPSTWL